MTPPKDASHEEFEKWYTNKHGYNPIRSGEGYEHSYGKRSWECWQAARSAPQPVNDLAAGAVNVISARNMAFQLLKARYGETSHDAVVLLVDKIMQALAAEEKVSLGDIAHKLTGLCGATCCHKTGGYGGKYMRPDCECRAVASEILETAGVKYVE